MEKLPPTSYVRMVDVWLIFGQLIPFVEVSLLTIMELFNDDRDNFNHHGTAIDVEDSVRYWLMDPPPILIFDVFLLRASKLFSKPLLRL